MSILEAGRDGKWDEVKQMAESNLSFNLATVDRESSMNSGYFTLLSRKGIWRSQGGWLKRKVFLCICICPRMDHSIDYRGQEWKCRNCKVTG
jgi:hypothetical protein